MSVRKRGTGRGGRERGQDVAPGRGGPSRRVPLRQPRSTGRGNRGPKPAMGGIPVCPTAVGSCWTPRHGKRGRQLKGPPTGGSAEQASNIARGTPGKRRLAAAPGQEAWSAGRKAHQPGSRPGSLEAVRL